MSSESEPVVSEKVEPDLSETMPRNRIGYLIISIATVVVVVITCLWSLQSIRSLRNSEGSDPMSMMSPDGSAAPHVLTRVSVRGEKMLLAWDDLEGYVMTPLPTGHGD